MKEKNVPKLVLLCSLAIGLVALWAGAAPKTGNPEVFTVGGDWGNCADYESCSGKGYEPGSSSSEACADVGCTGEVRSCDMEGHLKGRICHCYNPSCAGAKGSNCSSYRSGYCGKGTTKEAGFVGVRFY